MKMDAPLAVPRLAVPGSQCSRQICVLNRLAVAALNRLVKVNGIVERPQRVNDLLRYSWDAQSGSGLKLEDGDSRLANVDQRPWYVFVLDRLVANVEHRPEMLAQSPFRLRFRGAHFFRQRL